MTHPVIERLLGPTGPEIGCDECFDVLDLYAEAKLPESAADAMSAHLDGCSACREEYESLRDLLRVDGASS
jgi:anti-sigma factor RsiW